MSSTTPEPGRRQARFEVHGRVQGVGFRWWTRAEANRLGVAGEVRNRSDGVVEILASGEPEQLEAFARALREGPPTAAVDRVVRSPTTEAPDKGFEIVR